ncbi:MAG: hypothetical protein SGI92_32340 [Bryobacteraceae bacterium]|nr:hypothetical protein [Bryobacteraceae bacterium]
MGGRAAVALFVCALVGHAADGWKLVQTISLRATLHHVQGIDVMDGAVWVSSVDRASRKGRPRVAQGMG